MIFEYPEEDIDSISLVLVYQTRARLPPAKKVMMVGPPGISHTRYARFSEPSVPNDLRHGEPIAVPRPPPLFDSHHSNRQQKEYAPRVSRRHEGAKRKCAFSRTRHVLWSIFFLLLSGRRESNPVFTNPNRTYYRYTTARRIPRYLTAFREIIQLGFVEIKKSLKSF